jgi:hypothetical protein
VPSRHDVGRPLGKISHSSSPGSLDSTTDVGAATYDMVLLVAIPRQEKSASRLTTTQLVYSPEGCQLKHFNL